MALSHRLLSLHLSPPESAGCRGADSGGQAGGTGLFVCTYGSRGGEWGGAGIQVRGPGVTAADTVPTGGWLPGPALPAHPGP